MQNAFVCLSGFLSVTEYQRQLQASVVYLRLCPEADHAEGLVKGYRIVIPEVDASMSEQYLHLFVLVAITALVWWMGDSAGWSSLGKWLISITSGLYLTQWLWSNVPHEHLGVFENDTRRAAGRPWINGGFILGLLLTLVNVVYYAYNRPFESFASYYVMWWSFTLLITFVWGGIAICYRALNRSALDDMIDSVAGGISRNVRRVALKQFIRSFFLDMLPIDWEIKIRNKHIERLDRKERE